MTDDFWSSKEISARYASVKPLGSGGMGTVYLVKDNVLNKLVAIKVLDANLTAEQSMRFQREAKLSGKLKHKNIVSILDFGVSEKNVPYLVMEYLPGRSLAALLKNSPLTLGEAIPIFEAICAGMIHSHANGILHRDLKPENIIVSESGDHDRVIKIVDFGIARMKEFDGKLTQSGAILGSPLYMAPEQSEGTTDERSEIYSMGCLMFATLTGKPPFIGDSPLETLIFHKSSTPASLSEMADQSFPPEAEEIIAKCLSKNPGDRYQSFTALKQHLADLDLTVPFPSETEHQENEDDSHSTHLKTPTGWNRLLSKKLAILFLTALIPMGIVALILGDFKEPIEHKVEPIKIEIEPFTTSTYNGRLTVQSQVEVTDNDLSILERYPKIDVLLLKRTNVTGVGFKNWTGPHIASIFLDGSPVNYDGLNVIRTLPGLHTLSLKQVNTLTTDCLRLIAMDSNIATFSFSCDQLNESSLAAFSNSTSLRVLHIEYMQISEKGIESVLAMRNLADLKLCKCILTDGAVKRLQKPNKLECLWFVDEAIDGKRLDRLLSVSVKTLGFFKVKLKVADVKKLKGDKRIAYLGVTSPGITKKEIIELKNSFPNHPEFVITGDKVNPMLDATAANRDFFDK